MLHWDCRLAALRPAAAARDLVSFAAVRGSGSGPVSTFVLRPHHVCSWGKSGLLSVCARRLAESDMPRDNQSRWSRAVTSIAAVVVACKARFANA